MAQTTEPYTGNGTRGSAGNALSFTFPYLKLSDVKVALNGTTLATTEYTFPTATTLQFNTGSETTLQETSGAPKTGVSILIYRDTNVDSARHVFGQGSAFKSKDLNENKEQSLYFDQEVGDPTNPKNFVTSAQISDGTSLSAADKTKLDNIEANAKDDQTGAEIKTLYEAESNTNAFTDAEKTKLGNVEANAKDDQTATEIKSLYESNSDTNAFTDNDHTKLDGIESNAINASNAAITNKLPLAGGTMTGNLTVSNDAPKVILIDGNHSKHYRLMTNAGGFKIQDGTNSNADLFTIQTNGKCLFHNDAQVNNNLTVEGNLIVNGTSTTLNTATVNVDDKNFVLNAIDSPTDDLAHNGGFTLKGDTDKTFQWKNGTDSWTSSEHIALPDNKRLKIGDGADFQLYFDGSITRIVSNHTGTTSFQSQGTYVFRKGQSENLLKLIPDGAVEAYYDSIKRLETTSTGVNVTGRIGVNTTSPQTTVHIKDTLNPVILLEDTVDSNQVGIRYKTTTQEWMAGLHGGQSQFKISNSNTFGTNDFLTINTGGDVHLPVDGQRLKFGAGEDLEIFHGASNAANYPNLNVIKTNNTNTLLIETAQGGIAINNRTGSGATNFENMMTITPNGEVKAFYDGVKKLETTSTGIKVTGRIDVTDDDIHITNQSPTLYFNDTTNDHDYRIFVQSNRFTIEDTSESSIRFSVEDSGNIQIPADNAKLQIGASQDLEIYHDGSNSIINNDTNILRVRSNHLLLSQTNNSRYLQGNSGVVELFYDNAVKLTTTSTGVSVTGNTTFTSGSRTLNLILANNPTTGNVGCQFRADSGDFIGLAAGGGTGIGLVVDVSNNVGIGKINPSTKLDVDGDATINGNVQIPLDNKKLQIGADGELELYQSGNHSYIKHIGNHWLSIQSNHLSLQTVTGSENFLQGYQNGRVDLHYDGSQKLETTSTGATVTTTSAANSIKNITTSTSGPSGGSDGDLWFTYVA